MEIKKNQNYRAKIVDLNSEGAGVAKIDGYTFFIEDVLPGEEVDFRAIKVGKNLGYGRVNEIIEESEDRVDLGDMAWEKAQVMPLAHMTYQAQLAYKTKEVKDQLERIGGFKGVEVRPCLGMEDPFHYRNKSQVPVQEIDGQIETGFYRRRSHDLIALEDTWISHPEIDDLVIYIRDLLRKYSVDAYDEKTHRGNIRHIVVKRGHHTGQIMVILVTNKAQAFGEDFIKDILDFPGKIVSIIQNIQDKDTNVILGKNFRVLWGEDTYEDSMLDLRFLISEKSFYQVNTSQAERLYQVAIDNSNISPEDLVLDAYCGIGTISLCLAKKAKEVYGIEISGQAIEMANKNKEINGVSNANFLEGDATRLIKDLAREGIRFDKVFVDPPRKGLSEEFIDTLIQMEIPQITYISCKPSSQARDLKILAEAGYEIKYVQPVDMFPQTPHVETIALIQKI